MAGIRTTDKSQQKPGAPVAVGGDEDVLLPIPNLEVPKAAFILAHPALTNLHDDARTRLREMIEKDETAPYLASLPPTLLPDSGALLERLRKANAEELEKLDARVKEAEENLGESELSEALRARATYYALIGEKDKAVEAHKLAIEKTPGLGARIDITLALIRIGLFFQDNKLIVDNIAAAKALVDEGGDWDRRNRLKVYSGVHALAVRDFKSAATNFLDALSTFTSTELMPYEEFIRLTVLAGVFALDRVDLKKKIIASPEILQVLPQAPLLRDFANSLYSCDYAKFFRSLAAVEDEYLRPSRLLSQHARYYTREMRIRAYGQLLESYRSFTMDSMTRAFGVSEEYLDHDLSRLISTGRLNCVIDKVNGVIETNRPDKRNAQYELVVKQGDLLLNQVQKLSRVIN